MKNKKADVPVVFLVIGVLAICGLAILSFIISERNSIKGEADTGLGVFEEVSSAAERVYFYKNINYDGLSELEIEALLGTPYVEVNIENNVLQINGTRGNMKVEYVVLLD